MVFQLTQSLRRSGPASMACQERTAHFTRIGNLWTHAQGVEAAHRVFIGVDRWRAFAGIR